MTKPHAELRRALGSFATGVTIVTARDPGDAEHAAADVGLTVNSFSSVSLEPPLVQWCIARRAASFAAFERASHYSVHVLAADQQALSARFASHGIDRFAGLELERGPAGLPLLGGCVTRFVCRIEQRYAGGDHLILLGAVEQFETSDADPLVYLRGGYRQVLSSGAG
ncbi:flavin reductase family protein [Aquimonas sp.]|jgi:3-hydroxy-9,10-secoandrosta-1,3,5(10)-triene-9,17-dione monooxygenase reductase component|uniref:flavin reductase family protein n=1 Tax=Aquimonas sp. TaxID=1872588 RepID=UPI0037C04D6B